MKVYIVLNEFYFYGDDTKAFYALEKAEEYKEIMNKLLMFHGVEARILELEVV